MRFKAFSKILEEFYVVHRLSGWPHEGFKRSFTCILERFRKFQRNFAYLHKLLGEFHGDF